MWEGDATALKTSNIGLWHYMMMSDGIFTRTLVQVSIQNDPVTVNGDAHLGRTTALFKGLLKNLSVVGEIFLFERKETTK